MPKGLPSPAALSSRKACVFSLDTSVIEAAGFRFGEGALKHLSGQLPPWLVLWMPDIVVREISQHRLENVMRSVQQIQAGIQDLRRHLPKRNDQVEPDWVRTAKDAAIHAFDDQFLHFLKSHNGIVLEPNHERLSAHIFDLYFQGRPPFGGGKDKKHEFPDAASLVMLELRAIEDGVQVIAVSKDAGWAAYAEQSERIYCVSSIQELTALFVSETPLAMEVKRHLSQAFRSRTLDFQNAVKVAIEGGLISLPWKIQVPHSYGYQFDTGVIDAKLKSFEVESDFIGVWITSAKNDACVAEMPVDIDVVLQVEVIAYKYDWSGEKVDTANLLAVVEQRFEIKLQLELNGILQTDAIADLVKNISLGDNPIEVQITRDCLGPNWTGKGVYPSWVDDVDDDIPF